MVICAATQGVNNVRLGNDAYDLPATETQGTSPSTNSRLALTHRYTNSWVGQPEVEWGQSALEEASGQRQVSTSRHSGFN
jgi:hypothetical protein